MQSAWVAVETPSAWVSQAEAALAVVFHQQGVPQSVLAAAWMLQEEFPVWAFPES